MWLRRGHGSVCSLAVVVVLRGCWLGRVGWRVVRLGVSVLLSRGGDGLVGFEGLIRFAVDD